MSNDIFAVPAFNAEEFIRRAKSLLLRERMRLRTMFQSYFRILHGTVVIEEGTMVPTMGVYYHKEERRVFLEYNTKFIKHIQQDMFKGDINKTTQFVFLVLLHECDHIRFGHLILDDKYVQGVNKKAHRKAILMAAEFQALMSERSLVMPILSIVDEDVKEEFIKLSAYPPEEWLHLPKDGVGSFWFWLNKILNEEQMLKDNGYDLDLDMELSITIIDEDGTGGSGMGDGESDGENKGDGEGKSVLSNIKGLDSHEGVGSLPANEKYKVGAIQEEGPRAGAETKRRRKTQLHNGV